MARLEEIKRGAKLAGVVPGTAITIMDIAWHGSDVVELTYKDSEGRANNTLLYRDNESDLNIIESSQQWNFKADGDLLRLVSEAQRIRLAYLFDPHMAVHTSLIQPLPHQITAVYEEMLVRQPLRFLLADDPGAGKTIMTGLFIKELIIRGDLKRCLIVCPGNLVEQWQDELSQKFNLPFDILTNDRLESARTGNAFSEMPLCIARLDKLSRDENAQAKLAQTDWDLIVSDEAHKMSASYFGNEVKETKRYKLGKLLTRLTRHFLLLTATPHNGKEDDFYLFMSLLDPDRFEGRYREGVHKTDVSDLMRRMVKEKILKFDGRPLFPERIANTVNYKLSDAEEALYASVTGYVREEFNRADQLNSDGRRGTIGFALTILQRRLASSPEAIYKSLQRRRERLEKRLREEELLKRGQAETLSPESSLPNITDDDWEDIQDSPDSEIEDLQEQIVDQATAAKTIAELKAEIETLKKLEAQGLLVRQSGKDRKWEELNRIIQSDQLMFDANNQRRKLIIFTEHRDTLDYLVDRIRVSLGNNESVVKIHGGIGRDERRKVQKLFIQDKEVHILVATDAAGEGVNLQRAHLMVNYDLPWNPNRIEQRFGRIHRIGQTEVCHLWNLVAQETREGDVYNLLLMKLAVERESLGGAVFNVLGKAIDGVELKRLMIEAIRYGDKPEVRARLKEVVDGALNHEHLKSLIDEQALAHDAMDISKIRAISEELERAEARRLQPHYIEAFFLEAFKQLGGTARKREDKRYELTNVPAKIRSRDREIGFGDSILTRYERICFEKDLINLSGKPTAEFVCPGHSLLESVTDLILERYKELLKQGAVLISDEDPDETSRVMFYIEHSIQDGRTDSGGGRLLASRRLQFVEVAEKGEASNAGMAPYLDYRAATEEEKLLITPYLEDKWKDKDFEKLATSYAIQSLVPSHLNEVKQFREERIEKVRSAVQDRLTKEIAHWDHRAEQLKAQELAGKRNARINSGKARSRADDLEARLQKRLKELDDEKHLSPMPPVVLGGAMVVPAGLLARLKGNRKSTSTLFSKETKRVELAAMQAVMGTEQNLGYEPKDVGAEKCGYDVESRIPDTGKLRFIEVKGRVEGADTVTITKNEILTGLNKPEDFILALVQVPTSPEFQEGDPWKVQEGSETYGLPEGVQIRYVRQPFVREPDFGVTSINYNFKELWERGKEPS